MIAVLLVPLCLFALVLFLDRLEASVVAPIERAERVRGLLESTASDDEVARQVAQVLAPALARPRRA